MLIRSNRGGCPLCGAAHASCGQPTVTKPFDLPQREDRAMLPTRKYHVTHNGYRTIMKLNERDLELYPDATPVDDDSTAAEAPAAKGRRAPANKARGAANKSRGGRGKAGGQSTPVTQQDSPEPEGEGVGEPDDEDADQADPDGDDGAGA